jgi:excisionase family DNA binding protein
MAHLAHLTPPTTENVADPWLSTNDAADVLGVSRTYMAMLIDDGRLAGATVSDDKQRRVPTSTVLKYLATREAAKKGKSTDYRAAAREAGMYEVSDADCIRMARRPDSGQLRPPTAKTTKLKQET